MIQRPLFSCAKCDVSAHVVGGFDAAPCAYCKAKPAQTRARVVFACDGVKPAKRDVSADTAVCDACKAALAKRKDPFEHAANCE